MVSMIHLGKEYALEKAYTGKVWRRTRRMVLLSRDKGYGVGLWKSIRKGWGNFKSKTRFEVGHERRINFWHNVWCNDIPLKESFPLLSTLATFKEAWVYDVQEVKGGMVTWNLCFLRHF